MAKSDNQPRLSEEYANRSWSERFSPNHEFSYSSGASCLFHFLLILVLGYLLTDPSSQDRGAVAVEMISIAPEPNPGDPAEQSGGGDDSPNEPREKAVTAVEVETTEPTDEENPELRAEEEVNVAVTANPTVSVNDTTEQNLNDLLAQTTVKRPSAPSGRGVPAVDIGGGGGGDSTEEIIGALDQAGVGKGDIGFSLVWGGRNDLDLYVATPNGQILNFRARTSRDGGILDRDANVGGVTNGQPVENIYWPEGMAPEGPYRVWVHYYANHGSPLSTPFVAIIRRAGKEPERIDGVAHSVHQQIDIKTINFTRN